MLKRTPANVCSSAAAAVADDDSPRRWHNSGRRRRRSATRPANINKSTVRCRRRSASARCAIAAPRLQPRNRPRARASRPGARRPLPVCLLVCASGQRPRLCCQLCASLHASLRSARNHPYARVRPMCPSAGLGLARMLPFVIRRRLSLSLFLSPPSPLHLNSSSLAPTRIPQDAVPFALCAFVRVRKLRLPTRPQPDSASLMSTCTSAPRKSRRSIGVAKGATHSGQRTSLGTRSLSAVHKEVNKISFNMTNSKLVGKPVT